MRDMTSPSASGQTRDAISDAELLQQINAGEHKAFDELLRRHGAYLYGVAHSLLGHAADAEDVVQESLMAAIGGGYRGEASVKTWLVAIVVRQAGMLRRKHFRHLMRLTRSGEHAGHHDRPSDVAAVDARLDLATMLRELSMEHRQVIVLRELEQMSYAEIAEALHLPRGTVESRLHRAREELREKFGRNRQN